MAKSVVVVKRAGELMAQPYISRIVKEYGRFMGTALIHDNEPVVDHKKGKLTEEAVKDVQEAFKDYQVVFYFSDTEPALDEDQQPFEVEVDKASGLKVAVALEGKFDGYYVKGGSHTNEYICKEEYLAKKLVKLFKVANAGLPGFLQELNDDLTQQEFANAWTERGFITLLAPGTPAISLANKGHVFKASYKWGDTSNGLNYTEKVEAPAVVEPTKPMSKLEMLKAKMSGKPVPQAEKAIVADLPAPPKAETAISAAIAAAAGIPEVVQLPPEAKDWTNKEKINWWVKAVGYKPDGFKDLRTKITKTAAGVKPAPAVVAATNVDDKRVDPKTLPDTKPVEAPAEVKDTSPKHVLSENMPILSPRQKLMLKKEWLNDADVIKTLGDDFRAMAFDPKRLKEFEDNYQTFYDGMGLPEDTWFSFEALMKLGTADLKALAQYAFNRQNDNVRNDVRLKSILTDPGNKIATKLAM